MPDKSIPLTDVTEYGTAIPGSPNLVVSLPRANTGLVYIGGVALRHSTAMELVFAVQQYLRAKAGTTSSMGGVA